jgi:hypothetical protein
MAAIRMGRTLAALVTLGASAMLAATAAHADAVVHASSGDVRAAGSAVIQGQRVFSGTTLVLGANSQATLKFDDDMQVVLNENTSFRLTDFRYRAQEPRGDRAVFDLLRGAMRFVTGIIGARNRNTVALRIPQATIGIRGTDFMVALVNPGFVNVISGSVATSNSAGTVVFGQGAIGQVASSTSLATPITAAQLPAAASSAFSNLAAAQVTAASSASAASGASAGAATGSVAAPSAGIGAAIAVGVGAAIVGTAVDDGTTATTHH